MAFPYSELSANWKCAIDFFEEIKKKCDSLRDSYGSRTFSTLFFNMESNLTYQSILQIQ